MSGKCKRVVLLLNTKIQIVNRLKKGKNWNNIAFECGTGISNKSDFFFKKKIIWFQALYSVLGKEEGSVKKNVSNFKDVDKAL